MHNTHYQQYATRTTNSTHPVLPAVRTLYCSVVSFKNVIKINEQNVNSIFNLGKIYSQQGKFELAKTYYDKILQIDKNNLEALYELIKIDKIQISADTLKDLETQENQNGMSVIDISRFIFP